MANDKDDCDDSIRIDQNALLGEMDNLTGGTRHIKAAGYGLAAPLSALRVNQMRAEKARAVGRYGANSERAKDRDTQLAVGLVRADSFDAEFNRTLVDPPVPDLKRQQAGIYGRVVEDGKPRADLVVGALDEKNEWHGHTCTGPRGDFSFATMAGIPLRLMVTEKDGAPLYRDETERTYVAGQVAWREIDLAIADRPCDSEDGGNGDEPEPVLVDVPQLVGLTEADAVATLRKAGLARGDRTTRPDEDNVGLVVEQDPKAGEEVERESAVSIVVGVSSQILMPDFVGAPIDIATEKLDDFPHGPVKITEKPDPDKIGIILEQSPEKDTVVTPQTNIALTVGALDKLVMPSLIRAKISQAKITLAELGLTNVETSERADPQNIGLVVDQKPKAGATIKKETKINLVVGVAEDTPDEPDDDERFTGIVRRVLEDQRFEGLEMTPAQFRKTLKDREIGKVSDLRKLSTAKPEDVRDAVKLRTLKLAKLLGVLLRAALQTIDGG
jgi:beta-lactam-binding protein with PASTA domain